MATGVAAGLGTVDLVSFRPDLPRTLVPIGVAILAAIAIVRSRPQWPDRRPLQVVAGLLAAWTAWATLSSVTSADPALALATALAFALLLAAALGVGGRSGSAGAAVVTGVAVTTHAVAALALAFGTDADQFPVRLRLAELEATHLAQVMALAILVAFLRMLEAPTRSWFAPLTLAGVSTLGLVLTGSRTTPIALVIAGALALVALRRWRLVIGGGVALVLLFGGLIATGADARIVSLTNRTSSELTNFDGANGRTTLWPEVLDVIDEHPIVGIGLGVDRERMVELNAEAELSWNPQHAHNLVLHLGLTTGWPGVVLVSTALAIALLGALWFREPWAAALVGFVLVVGVSEPVFRAPQLLWALLAMSLLLGRPAADGDAPASEADLPVGAVTAAASVLLALAIVVVWLEPAALPHRFRCRSDQVLDSSGLIVALDGTTAELRTPRGTSALGGANLRPEGIVFGSNADGLALPGTTARSVRCAAIRGDGVTVDLAVASLDLTTEGPGRILSISSGTEWDDIDLLLGQEADGLAIRIRSGRDHRNDVVIPGVFTDLETHRLTVSIAPDVVEIWRDGELVATWTDDLRTMAFDDWRIGRSAKVGKEVTDDRPFAGVIESVRIYEGVRAHDELPE